MGNHAFLVVQVLHLLPNRSISLPAAIDAHSLVPSVVDDEAVELAIFQVPSLQRPHGLPDERGGRAAGAEVDPRIDPSLGGFLIFNSP